MTTQQLPDVPREQIRQLHHKYGRKVVVDFMNDLTAIMTSHTAKAVESAHSDIVIPDTNSFTLPGCSEHGVFNEGETCPKCPKLYTQFELDKAVEEARLEGRKATHQSWSIVFGIGYDPDNKDLPANINTLREKWSRDEAAINIPFTNPKEPTQKEQPKN